MPRRSKPKASKHEAAEALIIRGGIRHSLAADKEPVGAIEMKQLRGTITTSPHLDWRLVDPVTVWTGTDSDLGEVPAEDRQTLANDLYGKLVEALRSAIDSARKAARLLRGGGA